MKKLINKVEDIVQEMCDGIVASSNKKLRKLKDCNVIVRKKIDTNKVALISGGGSGHEPAHAGYVGKGMLSAAVCGEIFTSPTPDMILNAITACNSQKGTLLVIKNYTGDVMNFQLAQQMAQAQGLNVDYVIVNDDVALADSTATTGRRGICGTILVHKCAGAMAETGASLAEVKRVAEKVIANTATIGLGLDACIVPAIGKKNFELGENEVEMGLGIHGEPGVHKEEMKKVDKFVEEMFEAINKQLKLQKGDKVAVIVNGMGATPLMELYIAARKTQKVIKKAKAKIEFMMTGNFMTAIDMAGMSITVTKLDDELVKLLKAKTNVLAFK